MKTKNKIPKKIANSFLAKHAGLNDEEIIKFIFENYKGCREAIRMLFSAQA
jgi:hypothetical protein